jgi:hypothetical protein
MSDRGYIEPKDIPTKDFMKSFSDLNSTVLLEKQKIGTSLGLWTQIQQKKLVTKLVTRTGKNVFGITSEGKPGCETEPFWKES